MSLLNQLEPLIPPPPISWWPPAPGWWLLGIIVPAVALSLAAWRRYRLNNEERKLDDPLRQAALEALAKLERPYGHAAAGPWLQELNQLLKRTSRERWPDQNCHTLTGRTWLAFLDNRCPAAGLTRWMILVEGGYRADCRLTDDAIDALYTAVETWIRKHV